MEKNKTKKKEKRLSVLLLEYTGALLIVILSILFGVYLSALSQQEQKKAQKERIEFLEEQQEQRQQADKYLKEDLKALCQLNNTNTRFCDSQTVSDWRH